jgi:hypothetical protein
VEAWVTVITNLFVAGPHPELAPEGSLRDYFAKNSYFTLSVTSNVFPSWADSPFDETTVANGTSGVTCCNLESALIDALNTVDQVLDFRALDSDGNKYVDMITVCRCLETALRVHISTVNSSFWKRA